MEIFKDEGGGIALTEKEHEVTDLYLQLVIEEDLPTAEAARHALTVMPNPDPLFIRWLSQGISVPASPQPPQPD